MRILREKVCFSSGFSIVSFVEPSEHITLNAGTERSKLRFLFFASGLSTFLILISGKTEIENSIFNGDYTASTKLKTTQGPFQILYS